MKITNNKGFAPVLILVLVIFLAIGFMIYRNMQSSSEVSAPTPIPTIVETQTFTPTPATPAAKPGWTTFKNTEYGFEFSHPVAYKVLTDKNDLYGWENAILLLYKGGQSYDMAVEVWETEVQYKTKYPDTSNLTVLKTQDGKFITLLNTNSDTEVAQIISTFKLTP
jgi:hypothetical protein